VLQEKGRGQKEQAKARGLLHYADGATRTRTAACAATKISGGANNVQSCTGALMGALMGALVGALAGGCLGWWVHWLVDALAGGCLGWWVPWLVGALAGGCIG
jgi:LSD1 subclass zinc finger protein